MVSVQTGKYRHVVFADAINGASRAVNFAPDVALDEPFAPPDVAALSEEESSFVHWLFRQAGLNSENYREGTLRRRLPACLRSIRAGSIGNARVVLQRSPHLIATAASAMLIGVTSFFRDAAVFDRLREQVLPKLIRAKGCPRIWSVGCSDGAELYSVAMLLDDLGALERASLLGTDCRPDAIRKARCANYDIDSVRDLPDTLLRRHFGYNTLGGHYELRPALRRQSQWRVADVIESAEPAGWDIILCRNLAMYFKPSVTAALWSRLQAALTPGGFLVLGKAERPAGVRGLVAVAPCVYRRR